MLLSLGSELTSEVAAPSTSARRQQVIQYIIAALQKLAATRNLAVVVLTQCATRMQAERGATIIPAVNALDWDQGISTRLVLLRDWFWQDSRASSLRFVGVQKLNGRTTEDLAQGVVAFDIISVSQKKKCGRRSEPGLRRAAGRDCRRTASREPAFSHFDLHTCTEAEARRHRV